MSELRHASDYSTISGGYDAFETTSMGGGYTGTGGRGAGKGRFAGHKQYKKSKSLCTLETNLDDDVPFASSPSGENLTRVPSAHELRISKSLQKLNVPNWYKTSTLAKSGSCLLKYGSNTTMSSFNFSPSLLSSPCTTPSSSTNVVIKTRVQPPTARNMRSPRYPSSAPTTPSFGYPSSSTRDGRQTPVKLPSDKLRSQEKSTTLKQIPIVPFDKLRAMFEKKAEENKKTSSPSTVSSPTSQLSSSVSTAQRSGLKSPPQINGEEEDELDDDYEDVVIPRVVVSPTEPHVKSILKKSNSEKRYSDILESMEPDEDRTIIKPIPTRPSESGGTTTISQAPSVIPPPEKIVEEPMNQASAPIAEAPIMASRPSTLNYRDPPNRAPVKHIEDTAPSKKAASKPPSTTTENKKKSKDKKESPAKAKKGIKFLKNLLSSGSSSEDESKKDKNRKSPAGRRSPASTTSPVGSLSPNTSYDSADKFPASPASRGSTPLTPSDKKPSSPPTIVVTPEEPKNKGPTRLSPQDPPVDFAKVPSMSLEEAPIIRPPPPATTPAQEQIKPEEFTPQHQAPPKKDPVAPKRQSFNPVQETNLDDSYEDVTPIRKPPKREEPKELAKPEPPKPEPAPAPAPAPEPEKKKWFPKPKGWRSKQSKQTPASNSKQPEKEPEKLPENDEQPVDSDSKPKFDVGEISYEPRRLISSRSHDESFGSEDAGRSHPYNSNRSLNRDGELDRSRDSYGSRAYNRPRDLGRDYSKDNGRYDRKNSVDSERSFTRDLDRVLDRNGPRDLDRTARYGSKDSFERALPRDLDRRGNSRDVSFDRDLPSNEYDRPPRSSTQRPIDIGSEFNRRLASRREPGLYDDLQDRPRDGPPPLREPQRRSERDMSPLDRPDRDKRRGDDLDRSYTSRASSRDNDYIRDPSRRASDSYEDSTPRSKTSAQDSDTGSTKSSGRWQPKPRGSRSVGKERTPSIPENLDANGTSPYKYRVAGSAFSAAKPNTHPGLNTPPMAAKHDSSTQAAGEADKKRLQETTV